MIHYLWAQPVTAAMVLLPNRSDCIMSEDTDVYFSANKYQKMLHRMFFTMQPLLTFTPETHGRTLKGWKYICHL